MTPDQQKILQAIKLCREGIKHYNRDCCNDCPVNTLCWKLADTLQRFPKVTKICYMCNSQKELEEIERAEELFNLAYVECATDTGRAVVMEVIETVHRQNFHQTDSEPCRCSKNLCHLNRGMYALCLSCVVQIVPAVRSESEEEPDDLSLEELEDGL